MTLPGISLRNTPRAIIWIKTLFPFWSENQLNAQGAVTEIPGS